MIVATLPEEGVAACFYFSRPILAKVALFLSMPDGLGLPIPLLPVFPVQPDRKIRLFFQ